jgi:hypothetical protein
MPLSSFLHRLRLLSYRQLRAPLETPLARLLSLALVAGCASAPRHVSSSAPLQTRAEQSGYTVTSTYLDVQTFLDSLRAQGAPVALGSIGKTSQGREIPYLVASRPLVTTPEGARALHRPIVYVNANIHAGEVEGKEAILALVRDLVTQNHPNVLDSIVLIAVPIYNADGNEQFGPQSVNRDEQFGPELVGIRENAQGRDLNRDYMKLEAPETRGALAMFVAWNPDVYVDLHTTDGSYHGFALTYAPSLTPASYEPGSAGALTRDTLLPEIRRAMQARGFAIFDYGNFDASDDNGATTDIADTVKHGWTSFDHRPRFGTNYYGLRGHVSILSEAFSHDPFARRVASTYAFVSEILSATAKHAGQILQDTGAVTAQIPIQAQLTTHPFDAEIPLEVLRRTGDSSVTQPGVPAGFLRTGRFITQRMPVYDRFEPTLVTDVPAAYLIPPGYPKVIEVLRRHGVPMRAAPSGTLSGSEFAIDSIVHAKTPFQRHRETHIYGQWRTATQPVPSGAMLVDATGRLGALVTYLLDPESDDGLADWNFFDPHLAPGGVYPVFRVARSSDPSHP